MSIQAHDALFKSAFEHPPHAAGLFRHVLPPDLVAKIDWTTLELQSGSFVDPLLRSHHSDLLFSARIGDQQILLYVLLEHQSSNDPTMPLRSLEYVVRIWRRHEQQFGLPLPLLVVLVVSHAPEGWTAPLHLHALVDPPPASVDGVAALVPGFELLVQDLAHLSNDEIKAYALEAFPKLVLWALRDARNADRLLRNLDQWIHEFAEALRTPSGVEAIGRVLRYVAHVCENLHYEQFRQQLRDQLPQTEKPLMTMAEELIQKGRAEGLATGLATGRAEGQAALLVKMLTRKYGELPPEYRTCIQAATSEQLERYAERFVFADTLAAVFADD